MFKRSALKIALVGMLFGVISTQAQSLDERLVNYFHEVAYDCESLGNDIGLKRGNSLRKLLVRELVAESEYHALIVTNRKGHVIEEAVRGQARSQEGRFLGGQRWFSEVAREGNTYFTSYVHKTGRVHLMWALPLGYNRNKGTSQRVLVAKLDLTDSFKDFAQYADKPFEIHRRGTPVFIHRGGVEGQSESIPLEIPGVGEYEMILEQGSEDFPAQISSSRE